MSRCICPVSRLSIRRCAPKRWSSLKVAQLRYDERARRWRLYSHDSSDRWHPYEFAPPAPDVTPLLDAIEQDRTGIFWG